MTKLMKTFVFTLLLAGVSSSAWARSTSVKLLLSHLNTLKLTSSDEGVPLEGSVSSILSEALAPGKVAISESCKPRAKTAIEDCKVIIFREDEDLGTYYTISLTRIGDELATDSVSILIQN